MPEFRIPEPVARAMIEHAQAEYPKECCGFLVGPPGEVREQVMLTNIDPDPVMRSITAEALSSMGHHAESALPALREMAEKETNRSARAAPR